MNVIYTCKKIIFCLVLLIPIVSYSQETIKENLNIDNKGRPIYWNQIKVNAVGLVFGHWGLAYERKFDKKVSFQMAFDIVDFTNTYRKSSTQRYDFKLKGFGIEPEVRYYYGKNAMRGFFIGGYLIYRKYDADATVYKTENFDITYPDNSNHNVSINYSGPTTVRLRHFGVGILAGAQFVISTRVSVGFHFGFSVGKLTVNQPVTFDIRGSGSNPSGAIGQTPIIVKKGDNEVITGIANATASETEFAGKKVFDKQDIPFVLPKFGITIGYLFGY